MFILESSPPHESLSAPVPSGWTSERVESFQFEIKRAIDPDGCHWYWTEGKWILEVPYFRSSSRKLQRDDLAVVEHLEGLKPFPITSNGTIKIGQRRIPPNRWHH